MDNNTVENNFECKKNVPSTITFLVNAFIDTVCALARIVFQRHIIRNEIKKVKGPYVVIANHESALDFVNMRGLTRRKLTFVFSRTFYNSFSDFFKKMMDISGVITKQQFQTQVSDLKKMKNVINSGHPLVIYPAGLMCEDGISTPVPDATWKLLKFLDTDVYVAKSYGTYFVMPKWSKVLRPGRIDIDVYKLLSREEVRSMSLEEISEKAFNAIDFDAYSDQESRKYIYLNGYNTEGLENVVYQCPVCESKYSIEAKENKIFCSKCGFTQIMDRKGFLHCRDKKKEVRRISDWSRWIQKKRSEELTPDFEMNLVCDVSLMDGTGKGFRPFGKGRVTLKRKEIILDILGGEKPLRLCKSINEFPTMPFKPGRQFEIQDGLKSYRCKPENRKAVMEFINTVKLLHKASFQQ